MKTDLELQLALVKMLPEKIHQRKWLSYGETGTHENVTFTYIENGRELCDDSWLHVCWLIEQGLTDIESQKLKEAVYAMHKAKVRLAYSASWQQRAAALIDAQKLAARLRHPEHYVYACHEAADAIVKMAKTIETLQADAKEYRKRLNRCGNYRP